MSGPEQTCRNPVGLVAHALIGAAALSLFLRAALYGAGQFQVLLVEVLERGRNRLTKSCLAFSSGSNACRQRVELREHFRFNVLLRLANSERFERTDCQSAQERESRAVQCFE